MRKELILIGGSTGCPIDQALKLSMIAYPPGLLDCCAISDGSAAVVLTRLEISARINPFQKKLETDWQRIGLRSRQNGLDSSGLTLKDIDCVTLGTAPEAFDGIHMKGENLLDGAGAWRKPYF